MILLICQKPAGSNHPDVIVELKSKYCRPSLNIASWASSRFRAFGMSNHLSLTNIANERPLLFRFFTKTVLKNLTRQDSLPSLPLSNPYSPPVTCRTLLTQTILLALPFLYFSSLSVSKNSLTSPNFPPLTFPILIFPRFLSLHFLSLPSLTAFISPRFPYFPYLSSSHCSPIPLLHLPPFTITSSTFPQLISLNSSYFLFPYFSSLPLLSHRLFPITPSTHISYFPNLYILSRNFPSLFNFQFSLLLPFLLPWLLSLSLPIPSLISLLYSYLPSLYFYSLILFFPLLILLHFTYFPSTNFLSLSLIFLPWLPLTS